MARRFSYKTKVTDSYHLEIIVGEDGEAILKVAGTSHKSHFSGAEIGALHRALHECEMAHAEIKSIREHMGIMREFDKELVPGEEGEDGALDAHELEVLSRMPGGDRIAHNRVRHVIYMERSKAQVRRTSFNLLRSLGLIESREQTLDLPSGISFYRITDRGCAALERADRREESGEGADPIRPSELGMLREMADGTNCLPVGHWAVSALLSNGFIELTEETASLPVACGQHMISQRGRALLERLGVQEETDEELSDADLGERPRIAGE